MRTYMSKEYMEKLIGNVFHSSDSDLNKFDGLHVVEVIRELTEKEYDRELIDDTDKNEIGESRYLINTMYEVRLENDEVVTVYEDEINPDYTGSWEKKSLKEKRNVTLSFVPNVRNDFVKEPVEFVKCIWVCAHCGNELEQNYGWHCPHCGLPIRKIEGEKES